MKNTLCTFCKIVAEEEPAIYIHKEDDFIVWKYLRSDKEIYPDDIYNCIIYKWDSSCITSNKTTDIFWIHCTTGPDSKIRD